jgi:glycogen synthase
MARVLVVTNMYPPHHYGGYELSCRDVVERWRAGGHHVTVLTTDMRVGGVADPPAERAGGVWRDLRFYWDDHRLLRPPLPRRLAIERGNHRALAEALDAVQPDVVSVWHMGSMSLGLLADLVERDVPVVYVVCDDWLLYGPDLDAWSRLFVDRPRLARLAERATGVPCRLADIAEGTFCFVSDSTRGRAEGHSRWRTPRATVVYSGIEPADFPSPPEPPEQPWRWRLVYVGRIDQRKGTETAIRALGRLPAEATLDVLGRGDDDHLAHLHRVAAEEGVADRVRFGVVERTELAGRYRGADVVVFPSVWQEPFGLVPVEAMACGTPVVATGTGGSGEFLADGVNCLLFPARDHAALAAAVERLAGDPVLRRRLAAAGLATAADLTVDRLADVLEAWHLAAADRFRQGEPAHRPAPVPAEP